MSEYEKLVEQTIIDWYYVKEPSWVKIKPDKEIIKLYWKETHNIV